MTSTETEQITVIPYNPDEHFPLLRAWRMDHTNMDIRPDFFRHGGVAVEENGDPLAMYFIFFSRDVPVAHTQWATARPGNTPRETIGALNAIMEFFEDTCRAGGYQVMLTHCPQRLSKHISKIGFTVDDEQASSCFKLIGE